MPVYTRISILVAGFLVLSVAPGKAQAPPCGDIGDGNACFNSFSPGVTTGVYDFTGGFNGILTVQFDTVLTNFDLTVTLNPSIFPLDPHEFPAGTACIKYYPSDQCTQYDFSGDAASGGPHGVPVKNKDYKGLITLTLSYDSIQTVNKPAFGHAPGDITTFTEDILKAASLPIDGDPTMGGKTPGLSSVVALNEPATETDNFCNLALTATNVASDQKPQVEVAFQLFASGCAGTAIRDKTATLSLSTKDSSGNIVFPALRNVEGNKFHWDNKTGQNEYDISLDGLAPDSGLQQYTVTIVSTKFPQQFKHFCVDADGGFVQSGMGGCPL
jgi:hypothetical protein